MLEKLKAINWDRDYDPVLFGDNLAQALLELQATENQPHFAEHLERLDFGIRNSHPHEPAVEFVMPYLVWMCQNTPHNEATIQYLFVIGGLFNALWDTKLTIGSPFLPTSNMDTLRGRVNIYDSVAKHTDYFCTLLTADDDGIRMACFDVLRSLADEYLDILPYLVTCFESTTDMWVQALAIWYYALFAKRDWQRKKSSVEQLYDWMASDDDLLRFTATLGCLHLYPVPSRDALPDPVLDNIADYLKSDVWETFPLPVREDFQRSVRWALPFGARVFDLLRRVAHIQSEPSIWFELLKRIDLTPIAAHRHCRELLRSAFLPLYRARSNLFWGNKHYWIKVKAGEPITYHRYRSETDPDWRQRFGIGLNQSQKVVLEFIVNCDPFWEHPTNLFSHYYGLPDERDALRALL